MADAVFVFSCRLQRSAVVRHISMNGRYIRLFSRYRLMIGGLRTKKRSHGNSTARADLGTTSDVAAYDHASSSSRTVEVVSCAVMILHLVV